MDPVDEGYLLFKYDIYLTVLLFMFWLLEINGCVLGKVEGRERPQP